MFRDKSKNLNKVKQCDYIKTQRLNIKFEIKWDPIFLVCGTGLQFSKSRPKDQTFLKLKNYTFNNEVDINNL